MPMLPKKEKHTQMHFLQILLTSSKLLTNQKQDLLTRLFCLASIRTSMSSRFDMKYVCYVVRARRVSATFSPIIYFLKIYLLSVLLFSPVPGPLAFRYKTLYTVSLFFFLVFFFFFISPILHLSCFILYPNRIILF